MGRHVDREHLVGRDDSGHYGFEELVSGGFLPLTGLTKQTLQIS